MNPLKSPIYSPAHIFKYTPYLFCAPTASHFGKH